VEKEKDRKMMRAVPELLKTEIIAKMRLLDQLDKKSLDDKPEDEHGADSMQVQLMWRVGFWIAVHLVLLVLINIGRVLVFGDVTNAPSTRLFATLVQFCHSIGEACSVAVSGLLVRGVNSSADVDDARIQISTPTKDESGQDDFGGFVIGVLKSQGLID
jgi:hypothetical protein